MFSLSVCTIKQQHLQNISITRLLSLRKGVLDYCVKLAQHTPLLYCLQYGSVTALNSVYNIECTTTIYWHNKSV